MIELHDGRIAEWGELKTHCNFTKKHCSLKDRTPAEQALTAVDGKNEWIALTQDASLHKERDDATGVKYAIIIIVIIIPRFLSSHICPHTHSFCILDSQALHQTLHQG